MLISAIVLIVLRLFCIQWVLEGLVVLASTLGLAHRGTNILRAGVASGILTLLASVVLWFAAPYLGRVIAGKNDLQLSIPVPPLRDLYAFAFVFVGLYFIVQSLGNAVLRLHYAFVAAATLGDFNPERQQASYELVRALITLVGGLLCVFFGKIWAGKLAGDSSKTSPQP
ncbi:MAG TPA: hypothetical protein VGY56_17820 [Verrucomicrobiae bacterium]|nr:hypothetical protein [Verrucomicrobiae bacterium]